MPNQNFLYLSYINYPLMKNMLLILTFLVVNIGAKINAQSVEYIKGQQDAAIHYPKKHTGSGWTVGATIVASPVIGAIPAIACALTKPSIENLGMPTSELSTNADYIKGYTKEAGKMKTKKVLVSYTAASVSWLVAYALLQSAIN